MAKACMTLELNCEKYLGGELLEGSVRLFVPKSAEITLEKLVLNIYGREKTFFSPGIGKRRRLFGDKRILIDARQDLTKTLQCSRKDLRILEGGNYEVPFLYFLPRNLPSSIDLPHGSIKYLCNCYSIQQYQ